MSFFASDISPRTGGALLADSLIALGAETIFCVPGESYLAFLDAAYDRKADLRLVVCRQEGGAAYMAEAHGKMTGRPGICFVTRGPGSCNASIGVHTAFQDGTPMLLLIGQVGRDFLGREAFQEVDQVAFYRPLAKWAEQVTDAARLPEMVARAWAAATSGRPGPAVLVLPEDVLRETAMALEPSPHESPRPAPEPSALTALATLLQEAERPLAVVGGSTWTPLAARLFADWADASGLPVAADFRCQDIVDNDRACYVGELGTSVAPGLAQRVREADLILAVGSRLGEMATQGYSLIESPRPRQRLIHVFPAAEEIGRVFAPALGIVSAMEPFAQALHDRLPVDEGLRETWADWAGACRAAWEENLAPDPCPGAVDMGQVMAMIEARLPADAILTTGAGNYSGWSQRFHRFHRYPSQIAPRNGSMGYGVPAAIAAKMVAPDRTVISFSGDGCFLMNGQELATAVAEALPIIFLVINNGMYGTIRMHQEKAYPGRVSGTRLPNPDFAALARAHGAMGLTVTRTEEFGPVFDTALACADGPVLIEIHLDPQAISTRTTLNALKQRR